MDPERTSWKKSPLQRKLERQARTRTVPREELVALCREGLSVAGVAARLGLPVGNTALQLERLLRKHPNLGVNELVGRAKAREIEEAFAALNTNSLKRVREYLAPNGIGAPEIRIVRGYLVGRLRADCGDSFP